MVHSCIVRGCKSEWSPGCTLKFHTYPASIARRAEWLAKVPIKSKMYKDAKICSLHFKMDDYDQFGKKLTQSATPFYSEEHDSTIPKVNQETTREGHKMLRRLLEIPPNQACTPSDSDSDSDITELKQQRIKSCKEDTSQDIQPEFKNNEKDTTLDLMLSVGRNISGNPLVITLEPALAQKENSPSEHNYASKNCMETEYIEMKPEYILGDMFDEKAGNEVDPIKEECDETSQCFEPRPPSSCSEPACYRLNTDTMPSPRSQQDATDDYKQKYTYEFYKNRKLIEKTEKQQLKIQELQRKVKVLQLQLKRRQVKEKKFNDIRRVLRRYTQFSEIDNILQGRFMKLCSFFCKKDKPVTFSDDAKKFAVSMYYISPECYNLVKKYIQLPNTNILKKFLSSNTVVINLNETIND